MKRNLKSNVLAQVSVLFTLAASIQGQDQALLSSSKPTDAEVRESLELLRAGVLAETTPDADVFTPRLSLLKEARLSGEDPAAGDFFGWSTAISGDTAVIGAEFDDGPAGINQGSAHVFVQNDGNWKLQATLTASDARFLGLFGHSVSISGDTLVVGAQSSSAYVFTRRGDSWTEQAKITPPGGTFSVSLDGDTLAVGTQGNIVFVYVRQADSWNLQAKLTADDPTGNDFFGCSVSLDADSLVIGARDADGRAGIDQGSAYVYVREGTGWTFESKLTAPDAITDDHFGWDVSLSGDYAVVSACAMNSGSTIPNNGGSAYIFARKDRVWAQEDKLTAFDVGARKTFGFSVAIQKNILVVGDWQATGPRAKIQGAAYMYSRSAEKWTRQGILTADDSSGFDLFGDSVSLSGDRILIGAPAAHGTGNMEGGAYIYRLMVVPSATE